MQSDKIIKELDNIISHGLDSIPLPYRKGNSVRIKNFIIRKNSDGYLIFDCKENKRIAQTNFIASALAIVKNLVEEKNIIKETLELDRQLLKHSNDVLYFKNTIKTAKDNIIKESRKARLGVSLIKTQYIRQKLDEFIF